MALGTVPKYLCKSPRLEQQERLGGDHASTQQARYRVRLSCVRWPRHPGHAGLLLHGSAVLFSSVSTLSKRELYSALCIAPNRGVCQ